ncbi:hypothetical protein YB2330_002190 [Saitoella coloradoensis]
MPNVNEETIVLGVPPSFELRDFVERPPCVVERVVPTANDSLAILAKKLVNVKLAVEEHQSFAVLLGLTSPGSTLDIPDSALQLRQPEAIAWKSWKSKGAAKLPRLDIVNHKKAWDKKLNLPPTKKLKEEAEALTRLYGIHADLTVEHIIYFRVVHGAKHLDLLRAMQKYIALEKVPGKWNMTKGPKNTQLTLAMLRHEVQATRTIRENALRTLESLILLFRNLNHEAKLTGNIAMVEATSLDFSTHTKVTMGRIGLHTEQKQEEEFGALSGLKMRARIIEVIRLLTKREEALAKHLQESEVMAKERVEADTISSRTRSNRKAASSAPSSYDDVDDDVARLEAEKMKLEMEMEALREAKKKQKLEKERQALREAEKKERLERELAVLRAEKIKMAADQEEEAAVTVPTKRNVFPHLKIPTTSKFDFRPPGKPLSGPNNGFGAGLRATYGAGKSFAVPASFGNTMQMPPTPLSPGSKTQLNGRPIDTGRVFATLGTAPGSGPSWRPMPSAPAFMPSWQQPPRVQGVPVSRAMVDEAPLPLRQQSWIAQLEQEGIKVKDGEAKHVGGAFGKTTANNVPEFGAVDAKTEAFTFAAKFGNGGGLESMDVDTNVTAEDKICTKMERLHGIEKKLALVKAPEYRSVTVLHRSPQKKRKEEGAKDSTDRTEGKCGDLLLSSDKSEMIEIDGKQLLLSTGRKRGRGNDWDDLLKKLKIEEGSNDEEKVVEETGTKLLVIEAKTKDTEA